jgi:hypothetical protein
MKLRLIHQVFCVALSGATAACDLSTPAEPQNPIDLELDFCAGDVPVWFAYQNEDMSSATRIFPNPEGTFRFTATNRLTLGIVWQNGNDYHTEFIYATNEELAGLSAVACLEELGAKTVNGTVSGVGTNQIAVVSMGFSSVLLESDNTSYSLTGLPDRALDLIASRQTTSATTRVADRVVIRRTQNITHNGNAALIDFVNGSDVLQPATASATISGVLSGEFAYLQSHFFSQLQTSHSLSYAEDLDNETRSFAALPQTELAAGDYHDLILLSVNSATGSVRGAENFFRAPTAQTLALGPVLSDPVIEDVPGITGLLILRLQLPAQLSYDDAVSVRYAQQLSVSSITVSQFVTEGYTQGTPAVWALQVPNLRGAPGWSEAWELRTGTPIEWTVTGFSGRAELLFGAKPEDGEFVRYGIRHSDPAAAAASAGMAGVRNGSIRSVYTNRLRLHTP